jgi:hypothetical protein
MCGFRAALLYSPTPSSRRRALGPTLAGWSAISACSTNSGQPRVRGARTLAQAPGLYFVGISVVLAGLIREIAREATEVARRLAQGSLGAAH